MNDIEKATNKLEVAMLRTAITTKYVSDAMDDMTRTLYDHTTVQSGDGHEPRAIHQRYTRRYGR